MPRTRWLEPAHAIRGQDHLAARAVCESIYARLLPGLTNVTDRIRYYTFYPWLLWAHEQQGRRLTRDAVIDTIRPGECLLTMASTLHGLDHDQQDHGATTIGNTKLGPAVLRVVDGLSMGELLAELARSWGMRVPALPGLLRHATGSVSAVGCACLADVLGQRRDVRCRIDTIRIACANTAS